MPSAECANFGGGGHGIPKLLERSGAVQGPGAERVVAYQFVPTPEDETVVDMPTVCRTTRVPRAIRTQLRSRVLNEA